MKYQDGIVLHAAAIDGVAKAAVAVPRCDADRTFALAGARSLAKLRMKVVSFRYSSGAPEFGSAVVENNSAGFFLIRTEPAPESWAVGWPGAGAAAST